MNGCRISDVGCRRKGRLASGICSLACGVYLSGCFAPAPGCFAPEWEIGAYRAGVEARAPDAVYAELTEPERRAFLAALNSMHPPTGFLYDRVAFFHRPGHPGVLVVYAQGGCVWNVSAVSKAAFLAMSQRGGT
jgi:hypothetical protein